MSDAVTPRRGLRQTPPEGRSIAPPLVAGIDLGSTSIKMLVLDAHGTELVVENVATPWRDGPAGTTEMDASDLLGAVGALIQSTTARLAEITTGPVRAVAISGMGETGMVTSDDGSAIAPAFAWFDPRGSAQIEGFSVELRRDFAGRTGLPLGAQVTVAKLAYLRDKGVELQGSHWLNLPEFVAASLGGDTAVEYSLTSRTGLLDQDNGCAWPEMLDALGLDETFLPPLRDAGSSWGRVSDQFGTALAGAQLTVAGHDHLVAAQSSGELDSGGYHVSLGTAEVLLRMIDRPLGFAARQRLADHLINEVRHVEKGKHVLVAGVKSGLLLRRALQAAGITDRAGRDALDAAVMALPFEGELAADGIQVAGARNDDGMLSLRLRADGVTPAEIFGAVLRHSNDEIQILIDAMDREVPPAQHASLTGGWASMASVRRARERVLPELTVSSRAEDTAYGAALAAARLLKTPPAR